ncbi:MAG: hypothetical protein CVU11_12390 [Bacteroidetes bacterium HGW-Bacteroidetes-6]|jgi:hypothetical protein|nr:MAG: hypothetical protein CVU11_12390 [Bacteroidetes bacterium HGW-Bacteroidetes-6]
MRFRKSIILVLSVLISGAHVWAQKSTREGNEILWSVDRPLAWSDFKGSNTNMQKNQAAFVGTQLSFETSINKNQDSVTIKVEARMIKNHSWKLKSATSDYLLKHEQLHFDICELFARKLRKEISEMIAEKRTFNSNLNKLMKKIDKEHYAMQKQYDKETNHSLTEEMQAGWNISIANQLKEYEAWSSSEIVLAFVD